MKKSLIAAALLAGSAIATMANAADGTINFTGNITDAACTVTANTANQTVTMGTVASSALNAVGATAAPSRFNIVLTACPVTATSATVKFDGPADAANSSLLALTNTAGVATGVGIGLYEKDAVTQIPVGGASASQALSTTADTTFEFFAKYVATNATVVAGSANAVSDFTVIYN
ncbi:putative major fimbrial subunit LpfA [Pseudomonas chlororaphis]|uniref:fimbrial protein n=1 Tax=Pseudomonas TaxID=286 RepID=UPI000D73C285|nr:fimbrial protein [Pseudomonas sp. RW409]PWY53222.1 fimbrial protein [Pseudomonas sp. RW409]